MVLELKEQVWGTKNYSPRPTIMLIQFQLKIDSSNVDDLTTLEILNLLSIGLSSCNYKLHVPSDIPMNGYFVDNSNLKIQHYLEERGSYSSAQLNK